MEAYRKILTVKDSILEILLPEIFRNRKIEVIILPSESIADEKFIASKYDFTQYYGKIKSGLSLEEIDQQLKSLRGEWDRLSD